MELKQPVKLKLDLAKEGLPIAFREYEELMLKQLWDVDNTIPMSMPPKAGSNILWTEVNKKLKEKYGDGKGGSISRASVIFAANRNVDNGIWGFDDMTGKGGHHRVYFAEMSEQDLWAAIGELVSEKLERAQR